jgi:hypothetical protein
MTFDELISKIDTVKLEAERFTLQPDQARAMLTERGLVRKRAPRRQGKTPAEPKPKVKRHRVVLHLTEAQERAYANYLEGMK